ncbi:hypothetical protein JOD57_001256 [Geodermatophilus bullaregiensis]|nr:hypothetical protein [Geodermatophilus bullaregiensis]MBM7805419.1 hypothetical protein [Geodermatophilus bullaregiensis]
MRSTTRRAGTAGGPSTVALLLLAVLRDGAGVDGPTVPGEA